MRNNRPNKKLLDQIEALHVENEFLHNGIEMREDINDAIRKDKDIHIYIIKHLTYLILYMEALEMVAKDNQNHTSKIILNAINNFKLELVNNFYDDGIDFPNKITNRDNYEK
jgi:hypothetical protein